MDDLFRKAVERYPLKTCESRWDDISARINSKKRWVLFLPILFQHKKLPVSIFRGIAILIPIAIISLTPLIHKKTSTTILIKETGYSNISATISPKKSDQRSTPLHIPVSSAMSREKTFRRKKYSGFNKLLSSDEENRLPVATTDFPELNYKYAQVDILQGRNSLRTEIKPADSEAFLQFESRPYGQPAASIYHSPTLQRVDAPRRQGFYVGLLGGPMFSQVKNQRTTKPGFDVGMQVGYTISKRFSLETGLMYTRQYFAVTGDYLQGILNVAGIESLDGSRDAFAIPLKLKYNLITGSSGNFFLTTGFSSFVGVSDHIVIRVNYLPVPSPGKIELGPPSYLPAYLNFSLGLRI